MASNGSSTAEDTENSLEKIKRQLSSSGSARYLLQGPLLKRSETLRNWNERWMILDPTSGKMEYKTRRNVPTVKGTILFDVTSTITLSPVNFHGLAKYNGCCFYIGTPQKKDYFLCAETPGAAKAWVSTLHATQLVLRAHKEAVNSLAGGAGGNPKPVSVATVVAAANAAAMEASREIESAMKVSLRNAFGLMSTNTVSVNSQLEDDLTVMKETLRVKDEELNQLAKDMRARDSTIKEMAEKLTETAEAAESAASAAHLLDQERRLLFSEIERIKRDAISQIETSSLKARESEEKVIALSRDKETLVKQRDSALQEAQLWRAELAKARDQLSVLESAVSRAEERGRACEADADARVKEASGRLESIEREREELLSLLTVLQSQVQRQHNNAESCNGVDPMPPLTKHVDCKSGDDDVDKACLNDSGSARVRVLDGSGAQASVEGVDIRPIGDSDWGDVREVSAEGEADEGLDIRVVSPQS